MSETLREAGVAAGNIILQEFIANDGEIRTRERGEQHEGESSQEDYILYRWQSDGLFHRLPERGLVNLIIVTVDNESLVILQIVI